MAETSFTITPVMAIFILVIVMSVVLAITFLVSPANFKSGRASTFFACLAGFSLVILFFYYYMLVVINTKQQQILLNQESNILGNILTNGVYNDMIATAGLAPEYIVELNPLSFPASECLGKESVRVQIQKAALSHEIFSGWQLGLRYEEFELDPLPYVTLALQRAHSAELYHFWGQMRLDFNRKTQQLGDLLFFHAGQIPDGAGPKVYEREAEELISSSGFRQIFS